MLKIFLITILLSLNTFAGPFKVGNAGGGVIIQDQIYLLDLVESGQEISPFFDSEAENLFLDLMPLSMDPKTFPTILISKKISEIYVKNKSLGIACLQALKIMDWRLINYRLEKTDDLSPVIDIPPELIVQLANRRFAQVSIVKEYWQMMSPAHQAALVIHEIFNAMMYTGPSLNEVEAGLLARNMVGLVFSPEFKAYTNSQFIKSTEKLPGINRIRNTNGLIHKEWLENNYWANFHYFGAVINYRSPNAMPYYQPIYYKNNQISNLTEIKTSLCKEARNVEINLSVFAYEFSFTFDSAASPPNAELTQLAPLPLNFTKICKSKDTSELNQLLTEGLKLVPAE